MDSLSAIVLAGGTARRLGGVLKPEVRIHRRRMIDWVLESMPTQIANSAVVVVAPESVVLPQGVWQTLEDPPFGGPVAGIAAGLSYLDKHNASTPWCAVTTCDAPMSGQALSVLIAAADDETQWRGRQIEACDEVLPPELPFHGVVATIGGEAQFLLALYPTHLLYRAVFCEGMPLRDVSVKSTLGRIPHYLVEVSSHAQDLDTWADITHFSEDIKPTDMP